MKHFLAVLFLSLFTIYGNAYELPSMNVPDGLGVNIHFTGDKTKDLDMIKDAGFRFIRMDFAWEAIERVKGEYDFTEYDKLLDGLTKRGIRPIFILDYNNRFYGDLRGITTEENREAFANFAAAGAKRYANKGILWELWNEPNISGFWNPQPSADDYMKLANITLPMIKKADPQSICIAPATSEIDLGFLEKCFKQGLLDMIDAVSVHPYRQNNPESVESEIKKLRSLIAKYSPSKADIPIISGEWGYSTASLNIDDTIQGYYLPRQFLTNLSLGIRISIWYDWIDDGPDPKEPEHRFGTVTQDYQPKPSYLAMKRLYNSLDGLRFVKRLKSDKKDYILFFSDGAKGVLAAWTTGTNHRVDIYGEKIDLKPYPQYMPIKNSFKEIFADGSWTIKQKTTNVIAGANKYKPMSPEFTITVRNPFKQKINAKFSTVNGTGIVGGFNAAPSISVEPGKAKSIIWNGRATKLDQNGLNVTVKANIDGMMSSQTITFDCVNPIKSEIFLSPNNNPLVSLSLPEETIDGVLTVKNLNTKKTYSYNVNLSANKEKSFIKYINKNKLTDIKPIYSDNNMIFMLKDEYIKPSSYHIKLTSNNLIFIDSNNIKVNMLDINPASIGAHDDGDLKVKAEFKLSPVAVKPFYNESIQGYNFKYKYEDGWKFVRVAADKPIILPNKPKSIGVFVKGDGNNLPLRVRFKDAAGRTFQSDYGSSDLNEWRFLTAPINDPSVGSWGDTGSPDRIAYPIEIDTLILVDSKRNAVEGEIQIAGFQIIY